MELLVLIDDLRGIEVVGMAQGEAQSGQLLTGDWDEARAFAATEDFPAHHLVLRPQHQDDPRLHKGIADWDRLRSCFEECKAQAGNGLVFLETDLRAFANPSRMSRIGEAAADLLRRLQSRCPACEQPGYWVTERQAGLPCSACGRPTSVYQAEVWHCPACSHRAVVPRTDRTSVGPQHCQHCNP